MARKRSGFSCRNQTPAKPFVIEEGDYVKVGRVTPCAPSFQEKNGAQRTDAPTNETHETMSRLFSCIPGFLIPDKFKP
jgi:hypothetical protein